MSDKKKMTIFAALFVLSSTSLAQVKEITLKEAFDLAIKQSPALSAAKYRELTAEKSIDVERANYLPTMEFQAIESSGFPGSSGMTGVGGVMGSPYRSGPAYGVVARETLWDFGRTYHAIEEAEAGKKLEEEKTKITVLKVKQVVLGAFYDCSRFLTQREVWGQLIKEIQLAEKEVAQFVKTGQRSIVEKYLVEAQSEQALTTQATLNEYLKIAMHRLSILTGMPENGFSCPQLPVEIKADFSPLNAGRSPLIAKAQQEVSLAQAQVQKTKTEFRPSLVAVGSYGDMDQARLVDKQNYSVAAGIVFPLFDGFKTERKVDRALAQASEKEHELKATQMDLDDINLKYDQVIKASQVKIDHLKKEADLAEKAFALAKQRYFKFQGSLIDLREALKNLTRVKTDLVNVRADFLQANLSKALVNGELQ